MAKPIAVTDGEFDTQVLQSDVPVLVDFWAEWCQPCKMIAPIVDQLSEEYEGRVKFTKMDIDKAIRKQVIEFGRGRIIPQPLQLLQLLQQATLFAVLQRLCGLTFPCSVNGAGLSKRGV